MSPEEDIDQVIQEFAEIDAAKSAASTREAAVAASKGVRPTVDAAADDKKHEMSPIPEEQLRSDVLDRAINPEQRELLRLIGALDQAEERVMRIARQAEATIEQTYERLNQAATAEVHSGEPRGQHVLPVTMDDDHGENVLVGGYDGWQDVDIQMTLDSGCCKHVLPADAAPGYEIVDSPSSRRGNCFTVGNGARIPNEGQMSLNLETNTGSGSEIVSSVFQVAELNRPLMSVSQICSNGYKCVFEKNHATVLTESGEPLCRFEEEGGLYVANMRLKAPTPFRRQER
jgi:hypothetical protein